MFVMRLQSSENSARRDTWGPDQQDELSILAAQFKKDNDKIGLYLCALAEEEANRAQEKDGCMCAAIFYVSLALARKAEADHDLAHILLPKVQAMFSAALLGTGIGKGLQSTDG